MGEPPGRRRAPKRAPKRVPDRVRAQTSAQSPWGSEAAGPRAGSPQAVRRTAESGWLYLRRRPPGPGWRHPLPRRWNCCLRPGCPRGRSQTRLRRRSGPPPRRSPPGWRRQTGCCSQPRSRRRRRRSRRRRRGRPPGSQPRAGQWFSFSSYIQILSEFVVYCRETAPVV